MFPGSGGEQAAVFWDQASSSRSCCSQPARRVPGELRELAPNSRERFIATLTAAHLVLLPISPITSDTQSNPLRVLGGGGGGGRGGGGEGGQQCMPTSSAVFAHACYQLFGARPRPPQFAPLKVKASPVPTRRPRSAWGGGCLKQSHGKLRVARRSFPAMERMWKIRKSSKCQGKIEAGRDSEIGD